MRRKNNRRQDIPTIFINDSISFQSKAERKLSFPKRRLIEDKFGRDNSSKHSVVKVDSRTIHTLPFRIQRHVSILDPSCPHDLSHRAGQIPVSSSLACSRSRSRSRKSGSGDSWGRGGERNKRGYVCRSDPLERDWRARGHCAIVALQRSGRQRGREGEGEPPRTGTRTSSSAGINSCDRCRVM